MQSQPVHPAQVWEFSVPGGMVLAAPGGTGLYFLNSSAAFIWEKRRLGLAPDQIGLSLAEEYRLPEDIAQHDVDAALRQWDSLFQETITQPSFQPPPVSGEEPRIVIAYSWNDVNFCVSLDTDQLAAEICPRLSPLKAGHTQPSFTLRVTTNAEDIQIDCVSESGHFEFIGSEDNISAARAIVLQEIIRRANRQPEWLSILHAGACGTASACVIFPAASHSGKSTLAAVLAQRGLCFYADDSVALEKTTLRIPRMPFGLAIREGSWQLIGERYPGFLDSPVWNRFGEQIRYLYPSSHGNSAPAVAIVFTTYKKGAAFSAYRLNTFETLLGLRESGFWIDPEPESIRTFLSWLQSIPAYELIYDDVDRASEFIEARLSHRYKPKPFR